MMVVTLLWCNVRIITTRSLRRSPGVQLPPLKNYAKNSSLEPTEQSLDEYKVRRVAILHLLYAYPREKLIHNSEDPSALTSEITTVILSDFCGEVEESCLLVCHFYLPKE